MSKYISVPITADVQRKLSTKSRKKAALGLVIAGIFLATIPTVIPGNVSADAMEMEERPYTEFDANDIPSGNETAASNSLLEPQPIPQYTGQSVVIPQSSIVSTTGFVPTEYGFPTLGTA